MCESYALLTCKSWRDTRSVCCLFRAALLIFCALISFAIFRKHFKDTYGGHKGAAELHADEQDKYAGGWATLLINFFLTVGLSIALVLKFGLAGAIGTGALPEGTTSFSDAAAMGGGYQVDQA